MRMFRFSVMVLAATAWVACVEGDDDGETGMAADGQDDGAGDGVAGAPPGFSLEESEIIAEAPEFLAERDDDWLSLMQADWELGPGEEGYRCVRVTVPQDVHIGAFNPLIPLGTHHTVLSINEEPDAEDGITECTAFVNGPVQLGGSGVGTEPTEYPDGVAVRLVAGQQLLLNLHLFNYSDEPLQGTSGILVKTIDEADVVHRANAMLAGPVDLQIPPGRSTQSGRCTFDAPATIFGFMPHMHQLGVHMKATVVRGGDGTVMMDQPYSFDEQIVTVLDAPIELDAGDHVEIECTYENDTDAMVSWGDSSLQEMCFIGLLRYPEVENSVCVM